LAGWFALRRLRRPLLRPFSATELQILALTVWPRFEPWTTTSVPFASLSPSPEGRQFWYWAPALLVGSCSGRSRRTPSAPTISMCLVFDAASVVEVDRNPQAPVLGAAVGEEPAFSRPNLGRPNTSTIVAATFCRPRVMSTLTGLTSPAVRFSTATDPRGAASGTRSALESVPSRPWSRIVRHPPPCRPRARRAPSGSSTDAPFLTEPRPPENHDVFPFVPIPVSPLCCIPSPSPSCKGVLDRKNVDTRPKRAVRHSRVTAKVPSKFGHRSPPGERRQNGAIPAVTRLGSPPTPGWLIPSVCTRPIRETGERLVARALARNTWAGHLPSLDLRPYLTSCFPAVSSNHEVGSWSVAPGQTDFSL